jgi:hypothetical protein
MIRYTAIACQFLTLRLSRYSQTLPFEDYDLRCQLQCIVRMSLLITFS